MSAPQLSSGFQQNVPLAPGNAWNGIPIRGGSFLQLSTYGNLTNPSAVVNYRLERPDVQTDTQFQKYPSAQISSNRTGKTASPVIPLTSGVLTYASVALSAAANPQPLRGQCWAQLLLRDDQTGGKQVTLCEGYVDYFRALNWPNYSPDWPGMGNGFISDVNMSPAAGADISQAVPTNALWHVTSILAKFVASSGVATRTPKFQITDGTNVMWENVPGGATALNVTASQTRTFLLVPGNLPAETAYDSNNEMRIGVPADLLQKLTGGYVISSTTGSIQAGDQWTVFGNVEEWVVPAS